MRLKLGLTFHRPEVSTMHGVRSFASILLTLGTGFPGHARTGAVERPANRSIQVRLFNYASAPPAVLARAREEAGRILRRSGVETAWIECGPPVRSVNSDPGCIAKVAPTDLVIGILPKELAGFERHGEMGAALIPADGGFGSRASIFYNRVQGYAERWQASEGTLLGHMIAHEMGHLLLGAKSHSGGGIMRASWDRGTIEKAGVGTLLFSREEAKRMRAQVGKRMRASIVAQPATVAGSRVVATETAVATTRDAASWTARATK